MIRCSGADTMHDLVAAWAREFALLQPGAVFDCNYRTKLSAEGVSAMLAGQTDIVTFVREPFASEIEALTKRTGQAPVFINVAGGSYATKSGTHAIAIFVNAKNPITQLSLKQLDAIYSRERRRGAATAIVTWGQLGLKGEWAARSIHPYGMLHKRASGNPPGIVNFIKKWVLLDGEFRDNVNEQVDRSGETALDAIVNRVAEDPFAIGYSGFAYAKEGTKTLSMAARDNGPYVAGTVQNVTSRAYPLSRQIYLGLVAGPDSRLPALLKAFVRYVLSAQGQQVVAEDHTHFIPLTEEQARAADSMLEAH